MNKIFYYMLQWSWGIIQNLVGLVILLINIKGRHYMAGGALVTTWKLDSCLSMGMFIFMWPAKHDNRVLLHEFGHSIQSMILGPFYLLFIGLPSIIWAGFKPLKRLRSRRNIDYYRFYTEKWADKLGRVRN